ncbi:MAG: RNA-binding protein [Akkermansia sp.]
MDDDIICTEKIIADRKTFFLDLKKNARGQVVRITEKVSSNRDRIMVPAEIIDDFIAALQDIRKAMDLPTPPQRDEEEMVSEQED